MKTFDITRPKKFRRWKHYSDRKPLSTGLSREPKSQAVLKLRYTTILYSDFFH